MAKLDIQSILPHKNAWLGYKDAELYMRHSWLMIEGEWREMLVLASLSRISRNENIEYDPHKKRTGFMDELMDLIEKECEGVAAGVVAENIHNRFLPGYFERRGYKLLNNSWGIPSYYKIIP